MCTLLKPLTIAKLTICKQACLSTLEVNRLHLKEYIIKNTEHNG